MGRRGKNTVGPATMEANGYSKVPGAKHKGFDVYWCAYLPPHPTDARHAHPCVSCLKNGLDCQIPSPAYGTLTDKSKIRVHKCIECGKHSRRRCSSTGHTVSLYGDGKRAKRKVVRNDKERLQATAEAGGSGSGRAPSPAGRDVPLSHKRRRTGQMPSPPTDPTPATAIPLDNDPSAALATLLPGTAHDPPASSRPNDNQDRPGSEAVLASTGLPQLMEEGEHVLR